MKSLAWYKDLKAKLEQNGFKLTAKKEIEYQTLLAIEQKDINIKQSESS